MKVEVDATRLTELLKTKLLEEEAKNSKNSPEGVRQSTVFFRQFCGPNLTTEELLAGLERESPFIQTIIESLAESSLRLWVLMAI